MPSGNSQWAFPIAAVAKSTPTAVELHQARQQLLQETIGPPTFLPATTSATTHQDASFPSILDRAVWAQSRLVFDEPHDPDQMVDTNRRMPVAETLGRFVRDAQEEILIESAYLVLGDEQLTTLDSVRTRGVRVKALTNSLASNDVTPNHAAYARRRPSMLVKGMEIHELRPDAPSCRDIIESDAACSDVLRIGLHAKSMVFHRNILYVGSSNVNLRSIYLNFETALVVYSSEMANQVATAIERDMQTENSWQVRLDADGSIEWIGRKDGEPERWSTEPMASSWNRIGAWMWSLLPLEKYL